MSGTANTRARESESARRPIRIAAVGDLHFDGASDRGMLRDLFMTIKRSADILVLCGDLTTHGRPEQMMALVEEIGGLDIPVVSVLGNHDYEGEVEQELMQILRDAGVHVLDGESVVVDGVGFAGTKGFAGGFGRRALAPFGERLIKDFVQHALDEALKLENALRTLETELKVVVLHYAPIVETTEGEPEEIRPFLGSSRLLEPLETHGATVVFHGHAHMGKPEARTPTGIPVYNVARHVLRSRGEEFRLWVGEAPERRAAP
ncbi:MAG TPA: metallophosphoesterase [Longimicrobiales bacterium]